MILYFDMDTKPDISNLRLNQTPCTGQSAGNSINTAMASGNVVDFNQEAALYEYIDYPLMSPVDQLAVCAALPTDSSIDTIYLSADQESSIAASVTALNIDKKHMCAICEDRASGKHYGVYSCEGCKGFFKRTVRKDLHYACRDEKSCVIDRRQRNRCQYCRYQKCIAMGMKREAVQEERMGSVRDRADDSLPESRAQPTVSRSAFIDMPVDKVYEAEMASEPHFDAYVDATEDPIGTFCHAAEKQLYTLVDWAKRIPYFTDLPIDDQVTLLRSGWNELLIAGFSHRSINVDDAVLLATGLRITRDCANEAGIGAVFDRVMVELVAKMREMKMDKTELGCLRAIVLYNPDAKGLTSVDMVERLREKVYASLDEYCRRKHPNEPGRFAKLLLRLPALRSIGLKSIEHLFFYKLMADSNVDSFLIEMLDIPTASSPADTTAPAESSTFALCSSNS